MRSPTEWFGNLAATLDLPAGALDPGAWWRQGPSMGWDDGWAWMMVFGSLVTVLVLAAALGPMALALQ